MSVLDLEACPICQERDSLVCQDVDVGDRMLVSYQCLDCDSVLVWLGDDLWLEADRWAYQKIGRPALGYLLHRSITVPELEAMARGEDYPEPLAQPGSHPKGQPAGEWPPVVDVAPGPADAGAGRVTTEPPRRLWPRPVKPDAVPPLVERDFPETPESEIAGGVVQPYTQWLDAEVAEPVVEVEPDLVVLAEDVPHVVPELEPEPEPEPDLAVLAETVPDIVRVPQPEPKPDLAVLAEAVPHVEREPEPEPEPVPLEPVAGEPGLAPRKEPLPVVAAIPVPRAEAEAEVAPESVLEAEAVPATRVDPEAERPWLARVLEPRSRRREAKAVEPELAEEPLTAALVSEREVVTETHLEVERPWLARVLEPRRRRQSAEVVEPEAAAEERAREVEPVYSPVPEQRTMPARERKPRSRRVGAAAGKPARSRGSPFLVISISFVFLCVVCSAATMIGWSLFGGDVEQLVEPRQPAREDAPAVVPTVTDGLQPAPNPAPTEILVVSFQGVTDYVGSSGNYYVVGEVLNTSDQSLRSVEVLASYYDAAGELMGTGSTFVELGIIDGGSIAPFKLEEIDVPSPPASFKLRADYLLTGQSLLQLEVLSERGSLDGEGQHRIAGEVRNPHDFPVKSPEVVVTYYDARHDVVAVETASSELEVLQPGESAAFKVVLAEVPITLHRYRLWTEALRE
jgi:hypothetical protein